MPQYQKAVEKSRAAEALQNIKALRNAIDVYYLETGVYTTDMSALSLEVPDGKYFSYFINEYGPSAIRGGNSFDNGNYWLYYGRSDLSVDLAGKIICDAKAGYEQYCISLGGKYYGVTGYSAKRYVL